MNEIILQNLRNGAMMQHFILDKVISQTKHPLNKFWMNMPIIEYIACRPSIYVD
jgi:hypothetical protein